MTSLIRTVRGVPAVVPLGESKAVSTAKAALARDPRGPVTKDA